MPEKSVTLTLEELIDWLTKLSKLHKPAVTKTNVYHIRPDGPDAIEVMIHDNGLS